MLSLARAKAELPSLVDEIVRTGEALTVTRDGEPIVVVLSVEEYQALQETLELLADSSARIRIDQAQRDIAAGNYATSEELAELMDERRRHRG